MEREPKMSLAMTLTRGSARFHLWLHSPPRHLPVLCDPPDLMNSVHLIGRLPPDVEVKEVNGDSKVSSFILAVDRNAEEADFAILHTKGPGRARAASEAAGARGHRRRWRDTAQPSP